MFQSFNFSRLSLISSLDEVLLFIVLDWIDIQIIELENKINAFEVENLKAFENFLKLINNNSHRVSSIIFRARVTSR